MTIITIQAAAVPIHEIRKKPVTKEPSTPPMVLAK